MTIAYQDIVLLNAEMRARGLRYRVSWQDASTACIEQWFAARGARVVWRADGLYFSLEPRD